MEPALTGTRIRRFGSGCLRRRADDAAIGDPVTGEVLDVMWRKLATDGGVGLAAPQIGVLQRLVVVRDIGRPADEQRLDFVNPVLRTSFGEREKFNEGCLSFPGLYIDVIRSKGVEVSYCDRDGRPHTLRDEGLIARILQHELDHLDGVLFIDRITAVRRWFLLPRLLLIMLGNLANWRPFAARRVR